MYYVKHSTTTIDGIEVPKCGVCKAPLIVYALLPEREKLEWRSGVGPFMCRSIPAHRNWRTSNFCCCKVCWDKWSDLWAEEDDPRFEDTYVHETYADWREEQIKRENAALAKWCDSMKEVTT